MAGYGENYTHIRVTREVQAKLEARKRGADTYDDVLRRLLRIPAPPPSATETYV